MDNGGVGRLAASLARVRPRIRIIRRVGTGARVVELAVRSSVRLPGRSGCGKCCCETERGRSDRGRTENREQSTGYPFAARPRRRVVVSLAGYSKADVGGREGNAPPCAGDPLLGEREERIAGPSRLMMPLASRARTRVSFRRSGENSARRDERSRLGSEQRSITASAWLQVGINPRSMRNR